MTNNTYNVIETIQASAADTSLLNHKFSMTGSPAVDFRTLESPGNKCSIVEGLKKVTLNTVAVASFRYSFEIAQYNPLTGITERETIAYTSKASGDTATTINNAFRSIINLKENLHVAATGTTTLILTAETGYAVFDVKLTSGVLSTHWGASDPVNAASIADATITSNSAATPSEITCSGGHSFLDGQLISTGTVTGTDTAILSNKTFRIESTGATTFKIYTLDGLPVTCAGVNASGTASLVPINARGSYADLVAKGITGLTSGSRYSTLELDYQFVGDGGSVLQSSKNRHTVYFKDSAGLDDTNTAALILEISRNLGAVSSGTTTEPEAIAVA